MHEVLDFDASKEYKSGDLALFDGVEKKASVSKKTGRISWRKTGRVVKEVPSVEELITEAATTEDEVLDFTTEKEIVFLKPSEVFNFDLIARCKGDTKRVYRVLVPSNNAGMMRMQALNPIEQYGKTIHQEQVVGLQHYFGGVAEEYFDKLQELLNDGMPERSAVLEAIKIVNDDNGFEDGKEIQAHHADMILNFWNYINPLLAHEKKESKSDNTKK